jgi:hypothetical protein
VHFKKKDIRAMQAKRLLVVMVAVAGVLAMGSAANAATADCVLDGYAAMGGMIVNTTNGYLLPGDPASAAQSGMETFGYAFLKFDSADLPTLAVQSATLMLEVVAVQDGMAWPSAGTGSLYAYSVSSDVAGITAATAAAFRSSIAASASDSVSLVGSSVAFAAGTMISLDVTDIVNGWISSGNNTGLVLTNGGDLMLRLHSSESSAGADPMLTYSVPEPATMALLAMGAAAMLRRGRSSK